LCGLLNLPPKFPSDVCSRDAHSSPLWASILVCCMWSPATALSLKVIEDGWLHENTCFMFSYSLQKGNLLLLLKWVCCLSPVDHSFAVNFRTGRVLVILSSEMVMAASSQATLSNWSCARLQLSFRIFWCSGR
jgi:hypothetical protein